MIDSAQFPLEVSGRTVKHSTKDGAKHLPAAANIPNGKVLSAQNGQWVPSDVSGVSVSSVFGRTGAVTAQTGDYTPAQVGAEPALSSPAAQMETLASLTTGARRWVRTAPSVAIDLVGASPASPSDGDTYLTNADHPTSPHSIIRWDAATSAWIVIPPQTGWIVPLSAPTNPILLGTPGEIMKWDHAWTPTLSSEAIGCGSLIAGEGGVSSPAIISTSGTESKIQKLNAGKQFVDSSLSDDGVKVSTSEPMAINGATHRAWGTGYYPFEFGLGSSLATKRWGDGDAIHICLNSYRNNSGYSVPISSDGSASELILGGGGVLTFRTVLHPTADTPVVLDKRFEVDSYGLANIYKGVKRTECPQYSSATTVDDSTPDMFQIVSGGSIVLGSTSGRIFHILAKGPLTSVAVVVPSGYTLTYANATNGPGTYYVNAGRLLKLAAFANNDWAISDG